MPLPAILTVIFLRSFRVSQPVNTRSASQTMHNPRTYTYVQTVVFVTCNMCRSPPTSRRSYNRSWTWTSPTCIAAPSCTPYSSTHCSNKTGAVISSRPRPYAMTVHAVGDRSNKFLPLGVAALAVDLSSREKNDQHNC